MINYILSQFVQSQSWCTVWMLWFEYFLSLEICMKHHRKSISFKSRNIRNNCKMLSRQKPHGLKVSMFMFESSWDFSTQTQEHFRNDLFYLSESFQVWEHLCSIKPQSASPKPQLRRHTIFINNKQSFRKYAGRMMDCAKASISSKSI